MRACARAYPRPTLPLPPAYCLLPTAKNLIPPLPEAGRLTHMDPLAEDQVRPERLGDIAQQRVADETGERVFPFQVKLIKIVELVQNGADAILALWR
jgi:hypothetical protein